MKCQGCYKESKAEYCLPCRKKLFGNAGIAAVLPFTSPSDEKFVKYQEEIKRMSISGVQLKYSLNIENKTLALTKDNGHYILKPIPPAANIIHADQAPENERLTMQIAGQVFKLETAANALIYFEDGQPAYITRRFDVKADGTKYLQEDFAQLSGKSGRTHGDHFKYSGTYEDIGVLIKKYVAAYLPVMEQFFRVVFFNYLLSNGDAHLKNFSLLQADAGDHILAPAYDLMSTIVHVPGESDTALDLFEGDHDTDHYKVYGHHGYTDFMELSRRLGIMPQRAERMLNNMLAQSGKVEEMIAASLLTDVVKQQYLHCFRDKMRRMETR